MKYMVGCAQESYADLNRKSLAFFSLAAALYDADFVVKVDDDAFMRLDRLSHALTQWQHLGAGETFRKPIT